MAEHLTIPGALEWDVVERHSIATLRHAGGKEHDVKYVSEVAYDAALVRKASLREELTGANRRMGTCINQIEEQQQRLTAAEQRVGEVLIMLQMAACIGFSEARLDQTGESPVDCANQLQQRLTVAEQRFSKIYSEFDILFEASTELLSATEQGCCTRHAETELRSVIDVITGFKSELKPAEGEGS